MKKGLPSVSSKDTAQESLGDIFLEDSGQHFLRPVFAEARQFEAFPDPLAVEFEQQLVERLGFTQF